jgi:hypothetical protein
VLICSEVFYYFYFYFFLLYQCESALELHYYTKELSLLLNEESPGGAEQRFEPETCLTAHSYTYLCHKKVKRL